MGEGQSIGSKDTGTGVDYSTGRVLKSLATKDLEETRKVDMVTFDARGHVLVKGVSILYARIESWKLKNSSNFVIFHLY